jgi:hypothetical protein
MPKIPNYSPCHSESPLDGYRWKHDTKEGLVVNVTHPIDEERSDWRVEIWDYAHQKELGPISGNKIEMRKVAVEWMKENPEGWKYTR